MNKVYKVIWNIFQGGWIVVSELAKGKQKSSRQAPGKRAAKKMAKRRLINTSLLLGILASQPVVAADICSVATAKELGAALNNNDCTDIDVTANIDLATYLDGATYPGSSNLPGGSGLSNNTIKFDFGTRTAITIDGGAEQYSISNGNNAAYRFALRGGNSNNPVIFTIKNVDLTTTAAANNANHFFTTIGDSASNVNVVFDNITNIPNSTLALMSYDSTASNGIAYLQNGNYGRTTSGRTLNSVDTNYKSGYTYNQNIYSKITIGTFIGNNASNPFYSTTYKQWVNGSKIDFTGTLDFYGTGNGGQFAYIFWNNTNDLLQNQLTFKSGANVSFNLDNNVKLTTGDGNGSGYSYVFEDGSSFELWSQQNVFGSVTGNNVGLQIGSYNKDTDEFGSGAKIIYAGVKGAQLAGDGITNLGGKYYEINGSLYSQSLINNGENNSGDVIFNLADGSNFNVTGTGINVRKSQYLNDNLDKATTNNNNSGIYVRSATDITATTGMNIVHNGTGEVVVKNTGILTTTASGITLSSTSGNNMSVDMSQGGTDSASGVINAISGTGISVGNSATDLVMLNLTGGEINTSGNANAVTFSNATNLGTHQIFDLTVNLGGSGELLAKAAAVKVALSNLVVNINDRNGFTSLAGISFLKSDNGTNTINVSGTGAGIATTNTDISNFSSDALQINVNDTGTGIASTDGGITLSNSALNINVKSPGATALSIADGSTNNTTTIGENIVLDATGATAIAFSGTAAKTFINQGTVKGGGGFCR